MNVSSVIDEVWQLGLGCHQDDYRQSDAPLGGILVDGEVVASFGKLAFGPASDPSIDLDVLERDDARARLAVCAPEMARLLLSIEWGNPRLPEVGCPVCTREESEGEHTHDCRLDALLRRAGAR